VRRHQRLVVSGGCIPSRTEAVQALGTVAEGSGVGGSGSMTPHWFAACSGLID